VPILPRDVRKALDLLNIDHTREQSVDQLAAACGVSRRTLQKHFRRFVGRTPTEVQRQLRMEKVRRELLQARPEATITEIAVRCGVQHLGRFAAAYRARYGESPSATMELRRRALAWPEVAPTILSPTVDRPVIGVRPFDLVGACARSAANIGDEISAALLRSRWVSVGSPVNARYQLHGKTRDDGIKRLRVMVMLTDATTGRHLWADRWDGEADDVFAFEERVATRVAAAVERATRMAEIERVRHKDPAQLTGWELTMKALPRALLIDRSPQAEALEYLERAMELAPRDALPVALAAWCHAQRGSHHLVAQPADEKQASRKLALRGAELMSCDPVAESLLGAARTLAGDFAEATYHIERALALDGGCAWAWNRRGILNLYEWRFRDATECFQLARSLDPDHPLNFMCSIGMAHALFEAGRYQEAARWFTRALAEHPAAVWINRFRAPAYLFAGEQEQARHSFAEFTRAYKDLSIAEVRAGLPYPQCHWDRLCEGLANLGMPP
jgi:AraC-like DNA-binding protein/Flp pilus assembly protein TadD